MNWSQESYIRALDFASDAHRGQLIPGSEQPYDIHLTKVAMEVIAALTHTPEADGDFAVQCALLHDSLEDTAVTYEQLSMAFGALIAQGVLALTKSDALPKDQKMKDSLTRILQQPQEVAMVKLADRITNMAEPPAFWKAEKRIAYRAEAQEILEALGGANAYLAARLTAKIAAYGQWIA
jgi:(p)ppGpp synthase/HD superfamily hydrolase